MPNEVEIVVTSKITPLRLYAERIESRIRAQGLAVDVLFPREDIPIRQVLADLSSRGTLYGIVLSPLNQEHGSITLNILFGQPEGKSAKNYLYPPSNGRISKAFFFSKSHFLFNDSSDIYESIWWNRPKAMRSLKALPSFFKRLLFDLTSERKGLWVGKKGRRSSCYSRLFIIFLLA